MTVPSLKGVITGLVDQSAANIGKTGKKSELQERILRSLRVLQSEGKVDKWLKARAVILQVASGTE
jgi:E3 SUMO-protein ligase PIAS1